jgi:hypothetical protein
MALLSLAVASCLLVNSANPTNMIISAPLIDRLGFEEYAFNLFLNYGVLVDGYRYEQDNASMVVSAIGDSFNIAIRCYHPDRGWLSVEFTHKQ